MVWIFLFAFLISLGLTGLLRRYALAASLLDIPNARSSHSLPTPRGGGVAIVIVFLLGILLFYFLKLVTIKTLIAFLGAGIAIAVIGFIDDHQHIPARWRLLAHFIGVAWGLFWLGGLHSLPITNSLNLELGLIGQIILAFYLVWLLNLYNFMDGIDGIASIEGISVCLGGIALAVLSDELNQSYSLLLLLMAVAGFLVWNFPPAKIFMGDAGSGFLGISLGLLSLQAAQTKPMWFWSWLILLGVFIVDATWTLIQRFLRGEKIYQAHRSHAYQTASRFYQSHKTVSLAVAVINLVWLLPMALWVGIGGLNGVIGLVIAYAPLLLLAIRFKAGQAE